MDKKNKGRIALEVILYILISLLVVILASIFYLKNTWPYISYAELLYHLKTSFDGTDPEMIYSALLQYGLPAVVGIAVFIGAMLFVKKKANRLYKVFAIVMLVCLLAINIVNIYGYNKDTRIISDFVSDILKTNKSDFVEQVYVNPEDVTITFPEKKRNLIYIYLESMEMSFSDTDNGGAFSDNYIPNLTKLSEANENFSGSDSGKLNGGISLPGTNWTSAALFAQTSGIPLDLPVGEDSITNPEQFFPNLITMGDLLSNEGYTNIVEMGSAAQFGGLSAYYIKHGNYEVRDYEYAKQAGIIPPDYKVFWGYEDEKLFEFAKKEISELANSDAPFNYTLFTMDTHCQDGYLCPLCPNTYGDNQYANVIACSDRQVSEFVDWIKKQDFYDNTTVVITGDHPTMDADFLDSVDDSYQRKTYTCILNSVAEKQLDETREYATLDLFPTILSAMGVELSSDRLGCGTNLYGTEPTIIEEYGKDYCIAEFSKKSPFVEAMVKLEVDEEAMKLAQDGAYIEVAEEEGGNTRIRLIQADNISCLNITELTLVVHDNVTNETRELPMEVEIARSGWYGIIHSDIPFSKVNDLDCEVYISVDDFDHYLFKKFAQGELALWDVRWDFGHYVKQEEIEAE